MIDVNQQKLKSIEIEILKLKKYFPGAKNAVLGEGSPKARLMFIGEAPGREEDLSGRPFIGRSGRLLTKLLEGIGVDKKDVYITSVVKFLPLKGTPSRKEIELCLPYLWKQIDIIKPKVICLLGNIALNVVIDKNLKISKVHGRPQEKGGITYFPCYHPAAAVRNANLIPILREDFRKLKMLVKRKKFS